MSVFYGIHSNIRYRYMKLFDVKWWHSKRSQFLKQRLQLFPDTHQPIHGLNKNSSHLFPFRNHQIIQNGQSTCSAKLPRLLQRGNPSRLVPQGGGGDNLLTIQDDSKPKTFLGFHWNNFGSSGIQRRCGHRRRQQDQHGETFLDDLVQRLGWPWPW